MSQYKLSDEEMSQLNARLLAHRQDHTHLHGNKMVQSFFLQASQLKVDLVRRQVLSVLGSALDNADDSVFDSYKGSWQQEEGYTLPQYWEQMFFGTAQSSSAERWIISGVEFLHGAARIWLQVRGLMG